MKQFEDVDPWQKVISNQRLVSENYQVIQTLKVAPFFSISRDLHFRRIVSNTPFPVKWETRMRSHHSWGGGAGVGHSYPVRLMSNLYCHDSRDKYLQTTATFFTAVVQGCVPYIHTRCPFTLNLTSVTLTHVPHKNEIPGAPRNSDQMSRM